MLKRISIHKQHTLNSVRFIRVGGGLISLMVPQRCDPSRSYSIATLFFLPLALAFEKTGPRELHSPFARPKDLSDYCQYRRSKLVLALEAVLDEEFPGKTSARRPWMREKKLEESEQPWPPAPIVSHFFFLSLT